jgi:2,4-dienoyl-CoA reductase-like NADH-dependent reductase (Old Yellow Enzyme family)
MNTPAKDDVATCSTFTSEPQLHSQPAGDLFTPLALRGIEARNRIMVSAMCQYCAVDGMPDDWHLVHLGSRAVGGAGIVMSEATAVSAIGRITPSCLGIWDDHQVEGHARIARFVVSRGAIPGIQLAHAGRKASRRVPQEGGAFIGSNDEGGWVPVAPSPLPLQDGETPPHELTSAEIKEIMHEFARAAQRAIRAGYQVIELHAAHGYLAHQFLSPLTNHRTDEFGGERKNRMRFLLIAVACIRQVIGDHIPLFVRLSCTDWHVGGWGVEDTIELVRQLRARGVDLVDCSSGGAVLNATIPVAKHYQVPFARQIRHATGMPTGAVGLIVDPGDANEIISSGYADLIIIGRAFLRDPYWAQHAYLHQQKDPPWPRQYGYAVTKPKD